MNSWSNVADAWWGSGAVAAMHDTPELLREENEQLRKETETLKNTVAGIATKLIAADDEARRQRSLCTAMQSAVEAMGKELDKTKALLAAREEEGKTLRNSRSADREALEELRVLLDIPPEEDDRHVLAAAIALVRRFNDRNAAKRARRAGR